MSIYKKLFKVTSTMDKMKKDTTNPFYNSRYFDVNQLIEAVRPALIAEDLLLLQPIKNNTVGTIIIDTESGESIEAFLSLPDLQDPQKIGSCITYYRRYTLQSLLGIEAEDDDANKAVSPPRQYSKTPPVSEWLNPNTENWDKTVQYMKDQNIDADAVRSILRQKGVGISKDNFELLKTL